MDTTLPTVTFNPADGDRVIDKATVITLTFDEPVKKADGTDLTGDDFTDVYGEQDIVILDHDVLEGRPRVVSVSDNKRIITLTLGTAQNVQRLNEGTYTITLLADTIGDAAGNIIQANRSATFTVKGPLDVSLVKNVYTVNNPTIVIEFDGPLKTISGDSVTNGNAHTLVTLIKSGGVNDFAIGSNTTFVSYVTGAVMTIAITSPTLNDGLYVLSVGPVTDSDGVASPRREFDLLILAGGEPTLNPINLITATPFNNSDTYINNAEKNNTTAIIQQPTGRDSANTNNITFSYGVVQDSVSSCAGTYDGSSTSIPTVDSVTIDGTYKICVFGVDRVGQVSVRTSPTFTRDTLPPAASYTSPLFLALDRPITPMTPTTTDTSTYTLKIGETLPQGLSLNPANGEIRGTPEAINSSTHTTTIVVTDTALNTAEVSVIFPPVVIISLLSVTFFPANTTITADNTTNITLTFNEPVRKANNYALTDSDITDIVTLTDSIGTNVAYTGSISGNTITLNPSAVLADGTYIITLLANMVKDVNSNALSTQQSATFTVDTIHPPLVSGFAFTNEAGDTYINGSEKSSTGTIFSPLTSTTMGVTIYYAQSTTDASCNTDIFSYTLLAPPATNTLVVDGTYYFCARAATASGVFTYGSRLTLLRDTVTPRVSYSAPESLTFNTPIATMFSITEDTNVHSYSEKIGYSLPLGLSLNTRVGQISGAPTRVNPNTRTTIIVATDSAGNRGEYTIIFPLVAATVPGPLTRFNAVAGNTEVTLSWKAPTNNGGAPIIGYQYAQRTGVDSFSSFNDIPGSDGTTTTYTVPSLTNNVIYEFKICAYNKVGCGTETREATAMPQVFSTTIVTAFPVNGAVTINSDINSSISFSTPVRQINDDEITADNASEVVSLLNSDEEVLVGVFSINPGKTAITINPSIPLPDGTYTVLVDGVEDTSDIPLKQFSSSFTISTLSGFQLANEARDGYITDSEKDSTNAIFTAMVSRNAGATIAYAKSTTNASCDAFSYTISVPPGINTLTVDDTYYFCARATVNGIPSYGSKHTVIRDTTPPDVSYTTPTSLTVGTQIMRMSPRIVDIDIDAFAEKTGYLLPPGLSLDVHNGEITGTPSTPNTNTHPTIIVVTDAAGNTGEYTITFPAVDAASGSPPTATVPGVPRNFTATPGDRAVTLDLACSYK